MFIIDQPTTGVDRIRIEDQVPNSFSHHIKVYYDMKGVDPRIVSTTPLDVTLFIDYKDGRHKTFSSGSTIADGCKLMTTLEPEDAIIGYENKIASIRMSIEVGVLKNYTFHNLVLYYRYTN